ncbi:FAS-associated factor 2-like [Oppia nitens]|uniref:FAS-associated factor 2-like n=1 Tax=Oppia nitens TaxID=1686743 RepID=UPI0023DCBCD8|nr:FAS-associated factor 2-like [Oppia nitens]
MAEIRMTVWSIISYPFSILYDTVISLFRFTLSLLGVHPQRRIQRIAGDNDKFRADFEQLYGSRHPEFFVGTYNQALEVAKREFKFLVVYLHSDVHEDTQEFCRSVLISDRFVDFVSEQSLLFWCSSVAYNDGFSVSQQLRESTYPFLALICLKQNRMVVVRKFEGRIHLDTLLAQLKSTIEDNETNLIAARLEREERIMNQLLRQEQDEAYEDSLRADQEKDRKKLEEKNRKEAEDKAKREIELEKHQQKERLLQLKNYLVQEIPPEPEANDNNATQLVIKLPNGTRLERRFSKSESIKYLYYFVFCNKDSPLNFKMRTNFPTRDLPGHSPQLKDFIFNDDNSISGGVVEDTNDEWQTLVECGLGNREMLFVNDLDA